jgi:hypothetical protein
MPDWIRKPGTNAHPIESILTSYNPTTQTNDPMDLPSGTTVIFRAKQPGATLPKFSSDGIVVAPGAPVGNSDRGRVRYAFASADLDTPGIYQVDIFATVPGLGTQVFPEDSYQYLLVLEGADTV